MLPACWLRAGSACAVRVFAACRLRETLCQLCRWRGDCVMELTMRELAASLCVDRAHRIDGAELRLLPRRRNSRLSIPQHGREHACVACPVRMAVGVPDSPRRTCSG